MRFIFSNIFATITIFLTAFAVTAQTAGSLDTSFGSNGLVATHLRTAAILNDMKIQPDKKIVVAGSTFDPMGITSVGMIARFNENGSLDTTFDTDGYVNSGFMKEVKSLQLLPDGKILVGGFLMENNGVFALARFNSNGALEGVFSTSIGFSASLSAIKVLPDNKIIAVGFTRLTNGAQRDFALVKYNADGSLDTTFGTGGRVASDLFGFDEVGVDCEILPDGKILVSGSYTDPLPNQQLAVVARYNPNGSIDNSFGTNGKITRNGTSFASADRIAVQPDGKFIIIGSGISSARYNSNGTFDTVFSTPSFGNAVTIQPNGKILISGSNAIVRYNVNATPDSTFGTGGSVLTTFTGARLAIAPDGKIVSGGTQLNNNFEMLISRHLNNKPPTLDFDGDSKTDVSIFRPSNGQWWFSRSSDGGNNALQFGVSTDKIVPADYTGDGKTDVAVYRPSTGEWFILRSEDFSYYAFPFGISTDIPAPADYDGDGQSDAAVYRASNSTFYIFKSSGGYQVTPFGIAGDKPVPADYDGDGKTDIAVYRAPFQWWILQSSNGLVTGQSMGSDGFCVPGDYTGDGKADIAAFSTTFNAWFIRRSETGFLYSVVFGTSTDKFVPGDYDGDGLYDQAFFRPSDNTWNIRRSTGGTIQQTFGTSGDIPTPSAFVP